MDIHLAIQVADVPLSKIIQNISFRYTRWINDKYQKTGHLFQGRYKALLVDQDSYILELVRYIHLNPVRAGLVKQAENYQFTMKIKNFEEKTTPWTKVLQNFNVKL